MVFCWPVEGTGAQATGRKLPEPKRPSMEPRQTKPGIHSKQVPQGTATNPAAYLGPLSKYSHPRRQSWPQLATAPRHMLRDWKSYHWSEAEVKPEHLGSQPHHGIPDGPTQGHHCLSAHLRAEASAGFYRGPTLQTTGQVPHSVWALQVPERCDVPSRRGTDLALLLASTQEAPLLPLYTTSNLGGALLCPTLLLPL